VLLDAHKLDWTTDGVDWPNREASLFVNAGGLRWHVQRLGADAPQALLLHGTAASTHSFAALAPLLSREFEVVAPDLPGHAFTSMPERSSDMSLPAMAAAVSALLEALDFEPQIVVGHSAGAAILAAMCLKGSISPQLLVSLNGALLPFGSVGRWMLPAMARLLFQNSFVPRLFSMQARDRRNVERLIAGTGSHCSDVAMDYYVRLFRSPAHVEAALAMMANWDLAALERDLPKLETNVVFVAASEDKAVPPEKAFEAARLVPNGEVCYLRGLGHLAHEEQPERIASLIADAARNHGVFKTSAER
jgi:magnesium chelatase accessory protein